MKVDRFADLDSVDPPVSATERARANNTSRPVESGRTRLNGDAAMSNGNLSNHFSFLGRNAWKCVGLAVLSGGLFLGGCTGKLKEENAALRSENDQIKESLKSTEIEKATLTTAAESNKAEADRLKMENATLAARASQPPQQPMGFTQPQQTNDNDWKSTGSNRTKNRDNSGGRIVLAGDTLFGPGSASLKSESKKSIDRYLSELKSAHSIRIEGYTDSDPIKNAATKARYPTNAALSKARADSVKSYLVSRGVSSGKIATVGKGSENPQATKKDSRRVEIVVAE